MNQNVKKSVLVAIIVVAVVFAGWRFTSSGTSETPHVEATYKVEPGHKSEKQAALEAQAKSSVKDEKTQADKDAALAGN